MLNGVTTTSTPTNATDATFRAWGLHLSTQLQAAGFVKTADTGQIDWATVLTPALANTAQGYEIYRFGDALQATAPIFFKIEYGSGVTSALNIGIWFTFGTGSNGSGTMTGPISTRQQLTSTAYATNPLDNFWSGSPAHFCAAMWCGGTGANTGNAKVISLERTKDSAGNDTSAGLLISWQTAASSSHTSVYWDRTLGTIATGQNGGNLNTFMTPGNTLKSGTQIGVSPVFLANGPFLNPGINVLVYANADIVAKGAVTFQMYGVSHTYMPIGTTSQAGSSLNSVLTGPSLMTRYD